MNDHQLCAQGESSNNCYTGFPMSDALAGVHLGRQLRELACMDNASGYITRLEAAANGCPEAVAKLQLHSWRAVLEVIMRGLVSESSVRLSVRSIPGAASMSFNAYVQQALERLKLSHQSQPSSHDFEREFSEFLDRWKQVFICITLLGILLGCRDLSGY